MSLFSCKDMVRLASDALDRSLTVGQRLALHTHLLMCPACARFRKHLAFLRAAASGLEDSPASSGVEPGTPFIVALIKATMKGVVMLVLSRKTGQRVHIGASVVVTVVEARDGQVRLAFDAPPRVVIDREEVRQRKRRSRRSASEYLEEQSHAIHSARRADRRPSASDAGGNRPS